MDYEIDDVAYEQTELYRQQRAKELNPWAPAAREQVSYRCSCRPGRLCPLCLGALDDMWKTEA
jgi:hypothetical protein